MQKSLRSTTIMLESFQEIFAKLRGYTNYSAQNRICPASFKPSRPSAESGFLFIERHVSQAQTASGTWRLSFISTGSESVLSGS